MIIGVLLIIGLLFSLLAFVLWEYDFELPGVFTALIAGCAMIALLICGTVAIIQNLGNKGTVAEMRATYESLLHQAEAKMYENDNEIGKKELANQIQGWNQNVARGKALQRDFWVGVFTPNIYDQFEPIPVSILS